MAWWETKSEYRGRWWSPEDRENGVQGVLSLKRFEPAVLRLDKPIIITLGDNGATGSILGEAADGTKLMLLRAYPALYARPSPGIPIKAKAFQIETVFVNGHWEDKQKIGFHELTVHFNNLGFWSNFDPFEHEFDEGRKSMILRIKPLQENILYRDGPFTVDLINWAPESESHGEDDTYITFKRETLIRIKADEDQPYELYIPLIETVQSFLCFCLGVAIYPVKIQGLSSANAISNNDSSASVSLPIDICTVGFRRHRADQLSDKRLVKAALSFEDLENQTQAVLEQWKKIQEWFEIPLMLFLSTLFNQQMYQEQKFITRAQCIEIYHRSSEKYEDTLQDPVIYDERLEIVKRALKEHTDLRSQVRRLFITKLKNGNKPAFKDRIDQILDRNVPSSYQVKYSSPDFAAKIVDNRNYLTHRDPKEGFTPASHEELTDFTQQLGRLFYLCLLHELALEPKLIEKVFSELQSWDLPD